MSFYLEPDSHVRDKTSRIRLLNYATKKELKDAIGVDTSNLVAKSDFIALKAEVEKVDINNLVNVPNSLNNLKAKVDDSHVDKLKTVPIDWKNLSDVVSNSTNEIQD